MQVDNYYKHRSNTDVVFKPINIIESDFTLRITGAWFNIVTSQYFIDTDTISINKSELQNWSIWDGNTLQQVSTAKDQE